MSILAIIISILLILVCVALTVTILMQTKKSSGLGSSMAGMGASQTYWDKNKGRSLEGSLELFSKIAGALMFVLTIALCIIK